MAPKGPPITVVFCGDRPVCADLVRVIAGTGDRVVALGLNSPRRPAADAVLAAAAVDPEMVFYGRGLASGAAMTKLAQTAPDLGICCGFAPILPRDLLSLPRWGWINVHRSYLPFNRGLDPLQWAVVDETPAGVTLHVMDINVDVGDIVDQEILPVSPTDDSDSLERRSDALVLAIFRRCWPRIRGGGIEGRRQDEGVATHHSWADCEALRQLDLGAEMEVGRALRILGAYSGNWSAAEFHVPLERTGFAVRVEVVEDGPQAGEG